LKRQIENELHSFEEYDNLQNIYLSDWAVYTSLFYIEFIFSSLKIGFIFIIILQ